MVLFSKVMLTGNLVTQPRFVLARGTSPVANGTVATNHRFQRGDEWIEETSYVDVTFFGAFANGVKDLPKGTGLFIEGRLSSETWKDKQTQKTRYRLKVIAERVRRIPSLPEQARLANQMSSTEQETQGVN